MRPWRPQFRSAGAVRVKPTCTPTRPVSSWRNSTPPHLPAIVFARADDDDGEVVDGQEPRPQPPLPPPPPPKPKIETRGAKPGRFVSDETRSKMSRAKEGRVMPLETRLKISMSRKGTVLSSDTKERMAEVRRRWWASKRKARKLALKRGILLEATATAAAAAAATAATRRGRKGKGVDFDDDDEFGDSDSEDEFDDSDDDDDDDDFSLDPSSSLDLERAVAELSALRAEVAAWISAFSARSGGLAPTRADAERSPQIYRKFIRFIALQDFVRSARGGGGGGGGGGGKR